MHGREKVRREMTLRPEGVGKQVKIYERAFRRATKVALTSGRFDRVPDAPREVTWRTY